MSEILDKEELVVSKNDWYPVSNDCRLGQSNISNIVLELLDNDNCDVSKNDLSPVFKNCKLGRYSH